MKKKIIKPIRKIEIKNKDLLEIKEKDYISLFFKPIFSDDENYKRHYKVKRIFVENFAPLKYKSRFNKTYPKKYLKKFFSKWSEIDMNKIYIPFVIKLIRKCNFNSHKKPKDVLSKSEYQFYKEYTKYVSEDRGYIWIDQYKLKKIYNKLTEDQKIIFNRLTKLKDYNKYFRIGQYNRKIPAEATSFKDTIRSWKFEDILKGVDDVKQTSIVYDLHDVVTEFGFKEELKKILGVDDIPMPDYSRFSKSEKKAMIQVLDESPRLFKIEPAYSSSSLESGPFQIVELGMIEYLSSFLSSLKISKKEFLYLFGGFTKGHKFRKENYSDLISEIKHVENKYSKLLEEDPKKAFKKLYNYHFISYGSNKNPITGISLKPPGYPWHKFMQNENGKILGLTKEWQHYQSKFLVRLSKNMYKKILKYAKKYPKDKYAKFFISGITQSKYGYRVNYPSKYLETMTYKGRQKFYGDLRDIRKNSIPRKL